MTEIGSLLLPGGTRSPQLSRARSLLARSARANDDCASNSGKALMTPATVPVWVCSYSNGAGGQARAMFGSQQAATAFAERHAFTMADASTPLVWKRADTGESATLTTPMGTYIVTQSSVDPLVHVPRERGIHRKVGWIRKVF